MTFRCVLYDTVDTWFSHHVDCSRKVILSFKIGCNITVSSLTVGHYLTVTLSLVACVDAWLNQTSLWENSIWLLVCAFPSPFSFSVGYCYNTSLPRASWEVLPWTWTRAAWRLPTAAGAGRCWRAASSSQASPTPSPKRSACFSKSWSESLTWDTATQRGSRPSCWPCSTAQVGGWLVHAAIRFLLRLWTQPIICLHLPLDCLPSVFWHPQMYLCIHNSYWGFHLPGFFCKKKKWWSKVLQSKFYLKISWKCVERKLQHSTHWTTQRISISPEQSGSRAAKESKVFRCCGVN